MNIASNFAIITARYQATGNFRFSHYNRRLYAQRMLKSAKRHIEEQVYFASIGEGCTIPALLGDMEALAILENAL